MSSFENVDLTITRLSIDVSTPNQSPILLSLAVKPTKPPYRAHSPVPRASTPQAQNNVQSKERMEAERRVEEAKARQREILTQQALEKERQRAEELVKKQQAAYAAAAEAQGQRMEQLRRQEAAKEAERRRQAAEMEQRRREAESRAAEAREQKMREMKAREDRERMIREEARLNFFNQQEQARRNKMAIDAKMDGSNAPPSLHPSQYSQPDSRSYEPISVQKKKSPSSFPPLEDYFIKPKQAASLAKPKKAIAKAVRKKITAPAPKQAPPKSAERRSLSARRVTPTVADRPKTGSPLSDRPKSTDKQKMQKVIFQFGELQGMLQRAASPAPRKRRNQLHNKNKVDDKKQREYEEKLKQLELEKKAQAGDKPWLTRGKSKEEKALEEEKRRIEQEMKDDEEAERRKVVKEAQMREREKREAERKAFQKLIAKKKKKKQNRSHSVGDEEDVILVAPNRLNAHPQQRKHQLVRLQPAQATPKKVAATSKEGSPQATHTPPKIGSSKGKVEREKEKRSEDVQRSSPFANVERGG
ncbi:hypothetical protein BLNAU_4354 [Blattamonas nauphoetae]|uniref:Uncharacterized protein n=1 Tax=Blattamonas nauphoetae TaxID=2049346 RepID=A0ABQ9YAG5_9EUKA|nr:hypothetical protein BLNAU_4354 [Blattamonas nauphoetae]